MSTGRTPVSLLNKRRRKEGRKQENEFVVLVLPMQNRHTYKGAGGRSQKIQDPHPRGAPAIERRVSFLIQPSHDLSQALVGLDPRTRRSVVGLGYGRHNSGYQGWASEDRVPNP